MGRDVLFETTIEALRAVPTFGQRISGDDRAFLLLDRTATRLLHASPAAAPLRETLADTDGRIDSSLGLPAQLRGSLSLPVGTAQPRLERLRLAGRLAPPLLCACLPAALPDGSPASPSRSSIPCPPAAPPPRAGPRRPSRRRRRAEPVVESVPAPAEPASPTGPALPVAQRRPRLPRRGDRGLAETVGASPAGRSWDDLLAGPVEAEPALAEALARRQTFRAVPVRWRIAGTRNAVAVDVSGAPRSAPAAPSRVSAASGSSIRTGSSRRPTGRKRPSRSRPAPPCASAPPR